MDRIRDRIRENNQVQIINPSKQVQPSTILIISQNQSIIRICVCKFVLINKNILKYTCIPFGKVLSQDITNE